MVSRRANDPFPASRRNGCAGVSDHRFFADPSATETAALPESRGSESAAVGPSGASGSAAAASAPHASQRGCGICVAGVFLEAGRQISRRDDTQPDTERADRAPVEDALGKTSGAFEGKGSLLDQRVRAAAVPERQPSFSLGQ